MSKQAQMLPVVDQCCTPLVRQALNEQAATELSRMFKALGDPVRLRLLSMIASGGAGGAGGADGADGAGEVCVCDLLGAFDVQQSTISHHLRVLREAGLVDCQRRGTWVYYWVIPSALEQLSSLLQSTGEVGPVTAAT